MASPETVTQLLHALSDGRREALDDLLPKVYGELRQLAHLQLRGERQAHTLNTTALIHEAYLKLVDYRRMNIQSAAHFYAVASQAMRRVLVDYARRRNADKRGGGAESVTLHDEMPVFRSALAGELMALDAALEELEAIEPRHARIVECRFFAGLTIEETAEVLGVSPITVTRDWRMARAWLREKLGEPPSEG